MFILRSILILILGLTLRPASAQDSQLTQVTLAPIRAVVSIAPLKGLIEPLLPPGSTIDILIPPGVSEHGYEIPPAKINALNKADLVVTVGAGLEPQVEKFLAANPSLTRQSVRFSDYVDMPKPEPHVHNHDGPCDHGTSDPHIWLDPIHAQTLVREAAAKIIKLREVPPSVTQHPTAIAMKQTIDALSELDREYQAALKDAPSRTIVVAHDAYGWLAKRYALTVIPIAGLHANEPKPADLKRAIDQIRKLKGTTVFVEPQLSPKAAQRVAEATGAKLATLDPLGRGDYFAFMRTNLAALRNALNPTNTTNPPEKPQPAIDG